MVPTKDSALLNWSTNFNTRGTASPITFALTAALMTAYTPLHNAFVAAYNAANVTGARSPSLTAAKDDAKAALLFNARELYSIVQSNTGVTTANKLLMGVTVRSMPTPQPAPANAPALDIVSVLGRTVKVRLHDSTSASRRGKPPGVKGAAVFSYVGTTPPTDSGAWKFEGNTTLTLFNVAFPESVAPGALIWVMAQWFNERAQSGPTCDPISTNVQFGIALAA